MIIFQLRKSFENVGRSAKKIIIVLNSGNRIQPPGNTPPQKLPPKENPLEITNPRGSVRVRTPPRGKDQEYGLVPVLVFSL